VSFEFLRVAEIRGRDPRNHLLKDVATFRVVEGRLEVRRRRDDRNEFVGAAVRNCLICSVRRVNLGRERICASYMEQILDSSIFDSKG
jgi:hypothetical protein